MSRVSRIGSRSAEKQSRKLSLDLARPQAMFSVSLPPQSSEFLHGGSHLFEDRLQLYPFEQSALLAHAQIIASL